MRRQSDFTAILLSEGTVPGGWLFGDSTKSTVQLTRAKKKFERETGNTFEGVQCYRLPKCELPAGLECAPKLYELAVALNGSTAQSKDRLIERAWPYGGSDTSFWNGISRLRDHPWNLPIESTLYYTVTFNSGRREFSTVHASTAAAQPGDNPTRNALELEAERHEAALQNMHRLRELRLRRRQEG
jgi:hypothetical protein